MPSVQVLARRTAPLIRGLALAGAGAWLAVLAVAPGVGHAAPPTSVVVVGSLQSELGCSADFMPDCAKSALVFEAQDGIWQASLSLPAGSFQYKVALNGSFTENYGAHAVAGGANLSLNLSAAATVKFYYDPVTHWITDNHSSAIVTAPGSYQSELGCPADFQTDCLRAWLQDIDGDDTYTYVTTALPAGAYSTIAAINESFDERYGAGGVKNGPNIDFTVPVGNPAVTFSYKATTHVLTVTVGTLGTPSASPSASAHPSTSASASASASGTASGTAGGAGGLPVTGSRMPLLLGGVGGAALVAGIALLVATRRPRRD